MRESEQHALRESLLEALPDATVIADGSGLVAEVNSAAASLFGYEKAEMVGQAVEIFLPPSAHQAHRQKRRQFVTDTTGPRSAATIGQAIRKDGSPIAVDIRLTQLDGADGTVVASIRDVSALTALQEELRRVNSLITGVFDSVTEQAVIACDLEGHVTLFNPGAERLLGYSESEVLGSPVVVFHDLAEVTERARAEGFEPGMAFFAAGPLAGRPNVGEWIFVAQDGRRLQVSLAITAMRDADGEVTGFIGVATDITARKAAEAALAASEERFRRSFENAPVGMMLISLEAPRVGVILRANQAMTRLTGYVTEELVGSHLGILNHPEERARTDRAFAALTAGVDDMDVEKRYRHFDGDDVWVHVSGSVVRDPDTGAPVYSVALVQDISQRKKAEAELQHLAMHDPLTGLGNRALLFEHLLAALQRSKRNGRRVGVLFMDLDDFKLVNDSLGHEAGDAYLIKVCSALKGTMRESDFVARFGGDEFVVLCEGVDQTAEMEAIARRVRTVVSQPIEIAGRTLRPSASIGLALSAGGCSAESLLRDADAAMYRAKELGKGRHQIADAALHTGAMRFITVEAELQDAIDHGDLRLHYQPCFDLASGKLVGVEALLRWQHPKEGLLLPHAFLDVAEARDLIVPIGAWVLETACRQAAAWTALRGDDAPEMWVNISNRQLGRATFNATLQRILHQTGLAPTRLWLEVTERQLVATGADAQSELNQLPDLGVRLAIDDFGTGHNTLEYLRHIRAGALKINNHFVAGLGTDPTSTALTSSIITLGQTLGMIVVAEGVETQDQMEALRSLGCPRGQGYLLARPATAEAIEGMLSSTLCRAEQMVQSTQP